VRDLSNEQRADLAAAVERLAASAAGETVGPEAEGRQRWLATLTSLLAIRDSAEQLAASAALSAAEHGADYPEIGAAAGMTRQGARRKWPGLAGLATQGQRKLMWWRDHHDQFVDCAKSVLDIAQESPWLTNLRAGLAEAVELAFVDSLDPLLIDAHAVAMNDPSDAREIGLLAALTADAYAATNGELINREAKACATGDCPHQAVVALFKAGRDAAPACREHAVEALRQPGTRIMAAFQPDVALAIFTESR
jgi:hypothetical protein